MITPDSYIDNGKYMGAVALYGLYSESKPTSYGNGSIFTEIDTGEIYRFDASNKEWYKIENALANEVDDIKTKITPIYQEVEIAGKTTKAELCIIGNLAILTSSGDFASVASGTTDLATLSDYIPRVPTWSTLPNTNLTGQAYVRINQEGVVQLNATNARESATSGAFQLIWCF